MALKLHSAPTMALLCALASPAAFAATDAPAQVFIDNGELNYVGSISAEANRQAFALYDSAEKKPAILSIRSKGGETQAGMALGKWVHAGGLTVKVMEYCFSSCANYVFTAAPQKVVSNFAVVGYHGGLGSATFKFDDEQEAMLAAMPADQRQAVRAQLEQAVLTSIAPQVEAERAFFAQIGVQQKITTLGQAPGVDHGDEKSIGWTFSTDDFAKLGVGKIRVVNPPWHPAFVNSDTTVTLIGVN